MNNPPLCEDFIHQAEEIYKNRIITPARTGGELIEVCRKEYPFYPIIWDNVEFLGKRFLARLNIKNEEVKSYLLMRDDRTELFYRYFRVESGIPSGWTYPFIYCYHNKKTDMIYSNDSLWSVQMSVLRGIDRSDINNCTDKYKKYLNDLYLFYDGCEYQNLSQYLSI